MNATRIQIDGRNAIGLLLAVVIMALTAALVLAMPELAVVRPSAATSEIAAEAARLAANPELMVSHRYVPPGGWTRRMPQHIKLYSKIDPDRDIGLLEFLRPQTIQAVSRADPLHNQVDPDKDIGLLEHFSVPNETKEPRSTESNADRDIGLLEFLRPQTKKEVSTTDPLHNQIDPDRDIGLLEFFKPRTTQVVSTPVAEVRTHPLLGGR